MKPLEPIKKLQEVIGVLATVSEDQFNMEHWWLEDGMAFDEERNYKYKVADGPCGCAVGHLIQKGLLSGEVLAPKNVGADALPYEYRDRIWVQISDALEIFNPELAEFMFSQYAYIRSPIRSDDVIKRVEFVISEFRKKAVELQGRIK